MTFLIRITSTATALFYLLLLPPETMATPHQELRQTLESIRKDFRQARYQRVIDNSAAITSHQPTRTSALDAIDALNLVAASYHALGKFDTAQACFQKVIDLSLMHNLMPQAVKGHIGLGNLNRRLGNFDQALHEFDSALAIAKNAGDLAGKAALLNSRGALHKETSKIKRAILDYEESIRIAEQLHNPLMALRGYIGTAQIYVNANKDDTPTPESMLPAARAAFFFTSEKKAHSAYTHDLKKGIALIKRASETLPKIADSVEKGVLLIAVSDIAYTIHRQPSSSDSDMLKLAFDSLKKALTIADNNQNDVLKSHALGRIGFLYENNQRTDEAIVLTQQAIMTAQTNDAPELIFRWEWQLGRLLKQKGETERSVMAYRRAIFHLNTFKEDLIEDCRRRRNHSYRGKIGTVYFELAETLLSQSESLSATDTKRLLLYDALSTIEQLKQIELQDLFEDECISMFRQSVTSIDKELNQAAVLYPILLRDRLEILLILSNNIRHYPSPVTLTLLNKTVRDFRTAIETPRSTNYAKEARHLYDWIVRPVEKELERHDIQTLIFVPDGPLRTIPIGSLHDGTHFLIDRFAVVVSPGMQLTDLSPLPPENIDILFAGITDSVEGAPPLPGVKQELAGIQNLFACDVLMNDAFSLEKMEQKLRSEPYSVVHIASHGRFDANPEKNYVLAFDGHLTVSRLEELMSLSKFRKTPVELLTLSACQTAAGDDLAALGLAGVALKAGARSALASLWFIDDKATAAITVDFYRHLKTGRYTKAKALQLAQRNLLKQTQFKHPAYWAPFLLIGNWM